tara:strand:- start:561 stop:1124 length:564 start_codon:yes stop_codon:yes gene_type:complete
MNTVIESILTRNSSPKLEQPAPSKEEMKVIYQAALRAPDHGWLRPTRFIEVREDSQKLLSEIFTKFAIDNITELSDAKIQKYKNAVFRAPMIIILVTSIKDHPRIPAIEQKLSTAASAQNILLSLHSLGYGAIWRTGIFANNDAIGPYLGLEDNETVIGYLYVGTAKDALKKIPKLDIEDFVSEINR